jgi:hypothetical protein
LNLRRGSGERRRRQGLFRIRATIVGAGGVQHQEAAEKWEKNPDQGSRDIDLHSRFILPD